MEAEEPEDTEIAQKMAESDITISVGSLFWILLMLYLCSELQLCYRLKQIQSYKENTFEYKEQQDDLE